MNVYFDASSRELILTDNEYLTYYDPPAPPADPSFIMEITTVDPNTEFSVMQFEGNIFNYDIDYGDGTILHVSTWDDPNSIHIYTDPGVYIVKMTGICEFLLFGINVPLLVTKIINWGTLSPIAVIFGMCENLTEIPGKLDPTQLSTVDFSQCYLLTSLPSDLFEGCIYITDFSTVFRNCIGLSTLPADLFKDCINVTSFQTAFMECSNLTTLPVDLFRYNTLATTFITTFTVCPLTSIPAGLFTYNTLANDFSGCFQDCTGLTGNAPAIWEIVPEPIGFNCFLNDIGLSNYASIPAGWK